MKRFRLVLVLALTTALLAFAVPAYSATSTDTIAAPHVPETVIVKLKDTVGIATADSVAKNHGLTKKAEIAGYGAVVLHGKGQATSALIEKLQKDPNVEYVEPDYIATIDWTPNDTYFASQQWGPKKVSAPAAWDVTKGSSSVLIAIVDTGVDLDHPDLVAKVRTDIDYDYVNNDSTAQDDHGHGTHCAGVAAASTNNATGIAGMCPNCQILPVKVLDSAGSGSYSAIANGIRYAADKGAKVISLSLGGSSGSTALQDAVNYANGKGALVVAAAGNSNTSAPSYPGYYSAAVAVAATDSNDLRASFSNYGSWVDTSAPGVNIYSTVWNNSYTNMSGTSMATPHVAGLAGLLFSQGRTQSDVRTRLTTSTYTDPVGSTNIPRRINAYKAVSL